MKRPNFAKYSLAKLCALRDRFGCAGDAAKFDAVVAEIRRRTAR